MGAARRTPRTRPLTAATSAASSHSEGRLYRRLRCNRSTTLLPPDPHPDPLPKGEGADPKGERTDSERRGVESERMVEGGVRTYRRSLRRSCSCSPTPPRTNQRRTPALAVAAEQSILRAEVPPPTSDRALRLGLLLPRGAAGHRVGRRAARRPGYTTQRYGTDGVSRKQRDHHRPLLESRGVAGPRGGTGTAVPRAPTLSPGSRPGQALALFRRERG